MGTSTAAIRRIDGTRALIVGYRLAFGLLVVVALVVQFAHSSQNDSFSAVNFFSYFTNLSNALGAVVLLWAAFSRRRATALDFVRGAAAVYLAVTGIVFSTLLREESLGLLYPWVNTVLHTIMPMVMVLDWLIVPPIRHLAFNATLWWLAFPLIYLAYSLTRGIGVDWYPYPFLTPGRVGGYAGVAIYALAIAIGFLVMVWVITWIGNYRRARMLN
ncbi:MAG: Pr6Pr family membrane protein [Corynebacteriales bacterium]|nr:Pr6Pr family membrane protein [Mycobacteriales bacterium]